MQVNLQAQMPQPDPDAVPEGQDDIDKALTNLQVSLEGTSITTGHVSTNTPPPPLSPWLFSAENSEPKFKALLTNSMNVQEVNSPGLGIAIRLLPYMEG